MITAVAVILGGTTVLATAVWVAVGFASVAGIETPKYEVVEERDGYEIRQYAPCIVAEVTVAADYERGMNSGFRKLADYIFGNNTAVGVSGAGKIAMTAPVIERKEPGQEIAMTAPVQERAAEEGKRTIAFVMPSEYTMETLPRPNNPEVRIVEVPGRKYAALTFSGSVSEKKMETKKRQLADMLARDGLRSVGEPMLCQYDPPWTPPFMRKNEIWMELADDAKPAE